MRGALGVAVLATGCFSVPAYDPDPLVTLTEDTTGTTVGTSSFSLHFAGEGSFHFPDSLKLGGVEVMAHDLAQGCSEEDEVGVRLTPSARVSAHGEAQIARNTLTAVLPGPAIVQMRLEWATQFKCDSTRSPGGTSTFTVFPDGRILRHDVLADTFSTPISASQCTCRDPGFFNLGTFWTLARAAFLNLYLPFPTEPQVLPGSDELIPGNQYVGCLEGDGYRATVVWRDEVSTGLFGTGDLIGFSHNLGPDQSQLGSYSLLDDSALLLGTKTCAEGLTLAEEYRDLSKAKLSIDGIPTEPSAIDGIYGGDNGNGQTGILLSKPQMVLTGPTPRGFAVWLNFSRKVEAPRARSSRRTGAWYMPQKVDEQSWIVWFPEPLGNSETITIEPR